LQFASAQEPATQPQATAGSEPAFILAEFTQSLNSKKLKPGEQVRAEVSQDVLSHGRIVVPASSKLLGYVTEAKSRGTDPESRLGIVFNKILIKRHHEALNVHGVVHALAAPPPRRSRIDDPDPMLPSATVAVSGLPPIPTMGSARQSARIDSNNSEQQRIPQPVTGGLPDPPSVPSSDRIPGAKRNDGSNDADGHMSIGMRPGVFGLKGLSLTKENSRATPGPVILSTAEDVKLDYGTQVLVKLSDGIPH